MSQRLGPYEIFEQLGQGGMGTVFRAQHIQLGRPVALKIISPDRESADMRARFRREMRIAARLTHPNLVRLLDCGEAGGVDYIAMELLTGKALKAVLEEGAPLSWREALRMVKALAGALAHLHASGIVHRDVKPGNVVCGESPEAAKLVDFGMARQECSTLLTGQGVAPGTLLYMAPEYFEVVDLGPAVDIWALGCTAYEMLTGVLPFLRGTQAEVIAAIVSTTIIPPEQRSPGVPTAVSQLVMDMLERVPAQRLTAARVQTRATELLERPEPVRVDQNAVTLVARATRRVGRARARSARWLYFLLVILGTAGFWRYRQSAGQRQAEQEVETLVRAGKDRELVSFILGWKGTRSLRLTLQLVRAYQRLSQDDNALKVLEEATRRWPDSDELAGDYANTALQRGDLALARKSAMRALTLSPQHALYLRLAGDTEARSGNQSAAFDYYRRAAAADPSEQVPRLWMIEVLFRQKRDKEAWAEYRDLAAHNTGRASVPFCMANILARLGQTQEADRIFAEGLRCPVPDPVQQVNYEEMRGNLDAAIRDARIAYRAHSVYREVYGEQLAKLLEKADRAAEAEAVRLELVRSHPANVGGWVELADQFRRQNQYRLARGCTLTAIGLNPSSWSANWVNTRVLFGMGRTAEGVRAATSLLQHPAATAAHLRNLAAIVYELDYFAESQQIAKMVIARWPRDLETREELARQLLERGAIQEALGEVKQMVVIAPDSPSVHVRLAVSLLGLGRPEQALGVTTAAVRRIPDEHLFLLRAHALAGLRNLPAAESIAAAVCRSSPKLGTARATLAQFQLQAGKLAASEVNARAGLALLPDDHYCITTAVAVFERLGKARECFELAQRGLRKMPGDRALGRPVIEFLAREGRAKEALAVFRQILAHGPVDRGFVELVHGRFLRANHPAEAAAVLEDLLRREPENVKLLLVLANTYRGAANFPAAEKTYRRILARDPANAAALRGLSQTLGGEGRLMDAAENLLKSLPAHR